MAIVEKILSFIKKKNNILSLLSTRNLRIQKSSPLIIVSFFILISGIFFISNNLIIQKNKDRVNNLQEFTKKNGFSNLTNFLLSKINSPYEELNYVIKSNDTIEKILK